MWSVDGDSPPSAPWCRWGHDSCKAVPDPAFWENGVVHLLEVAHSDIGWLGLQNDLLIDANQITTALDMMRTDSGFAWQHECILFLRAWVEMFPEREEELIQRMHEGRFDIGGTFTEGYENAMVGETLIRQMYSGRKWFVERYPGIDSAVVAFHQDGPLRSIQVPQIWAKAGMRYLKFSRFSDRIFRWEAPDGSSLLAFGQVHYCEGPLPFVTADVVDRMARWEMFFKADGVPPAYPLTMGCDYHPPQLIPKEIAAWNARPRTPKAIYSTFKRFLDVVALSNATLPRLRGERPNLWLYEACPPHHWLWGQFRSGGRLLPYAETVSVWRAVLSGSWSSYPEALLGVAWLNLTLDDHGIAPESVPRNSSVPTWVVNKNSPPTWDRVYLEKYTLARQAAQDIITAGQQWIAGRVNTTSSTAEKESASAANARAVCNATAVVFNMLSWSVADVVELPAPACVTPGGSYVVKRSDGRFVSAQRTRNGTVVFVAQVPSLGYAAATLSAGVLPPPPTPPSPPSPPPPAVGAVWDTPFSSPFFILTPGRGGLSSVVDRMSGVELFDTTHYAAGEWMSLTYTGMGASETRTYAHPTVTSDHQRLGTLGQPTWRCVESGPVRIVFATDPVKTTHSTVILELVVYLTTARVDFNPRILAWDSAFGVVNRVVFPLKTQLRNVTYSAPFAAVRVGTDENEAGPHDIWLQDPKPTLPLFERGWAMRPRELQDWIHAEVSQSGVGVLFSTQSVGVWDWVDCTGLYPATVPVLAPEMLLHTNSNQGPFLPEPGDHYFSFSLFTTRGGWRQGWRSGVQAVNPLSAVWQAASPGTTEQASLPAQASLLSVSGSTSWVTALKKQDGPLNDGVIVRLHDQTGTASEVQLQFAAPVLTAAHTNIIEHADAAQILKLSAGGNVSLALGAWSIETVRLDVF